MSSKARLVVDEDDEEIYYDEKKEPCWGKFLHGLGHFFGMCCLLSCCGCCCNPYKTVHVGSKGVIKRFGTVKKVVDPGLHYVNTITEEIASVDIMVHEARLSGQDVLTADRLPLKIDGCVYYRINDNVKDVISAQYGVFNLKQAINALAHGTLRTVFGHHTLEECLTKREQFSQEMRNVLGDRTKSWGVTIQDIQIIDIVMPKHIQDLQASTSVAEREAQAKIIMAEADVRVAHMMREAADQLSSDAAMQMRTLETLKQLAESENSKIIFMPTDYRSIGSLNSNIMGNAAMEK